MFSFQRNMTGGDFKSSQLTSQSTLPPAGSRRHQVKTLNCPCLLLANVE